MGSQRGVWTFLLCVFPLPSLPHRFSVDNTCLVDFISVVQRSVSEESSSTGVEPLLGRIPHRLSVVNTSGVHISVKTAAKYHEERLELLLLTWLQTVQPQQVHIVTDDVPDDRWITIAENYGFNVAMAAGCSIGHCRDCLCCKSGVEFEQYYSKKKLIPWYCHVDDDVYVNVQQLVTLLQSYNPLNEHIYLGRLSLSIKNPTIELQPFHFERIPGLKSSQFQFGTGALYCISAALMTELEPYLHGKHRFMSTCKALQYTDDMTIGVIIEALLGYNLTDVYSIHTQLNNLRGIPLSKLLQAVSISYNLPPRERVVTIPQPRFTPEEDPTRFLSYHCLIHPRTLWCN